MVGRQAYAQHNTQFKPWQKIEMQIILFLFSKKNMLALLIALLPTADNREHQNAAGKQN